ncbi:hypothetical protein ACFLTK_05600 [Chloroflexota bacterium]
MGSQLVSGQKLTSSGSSPTESSIAGYSILQVEDMEGAKALLKGHPHLQWSEGAVIDVFESASM